MASMFVGGERHADLWVVRGRRAEGVHSLQGTEIPSILSVVKRLLFG